MPPPFRDRSDAGRRLADALAARPGLAAPLVLALPRGGVPVAAEVARRLGAPLDVLVVRKLGVPGHEELAMGAIALGGIEYRDDPLIAACGVSGPAYTAVLRRERAELNRRERLYRGSRPFAPLAGRTVIVVDDGLATGATMLAAVRALQRQQPGAIIVATPVASPTALARLGPEVDAIVALLAPEDLGGIGEFYADFTQTSDETVRRLLPSAAP